MRTLLGIDEAGRGCVLGPMVYGACLIGEADESVLRELGARDSKKLSATKRATVRAAVEARALAWDVVRLEPAQLDGESLNELGSRTIVDLAVKHRPTVLVLDAPVPPRGIERWVASLTERLEARGVRGMEIVAENGADDRWPCCSAASLFAKTDRDAILAELEASAGARLGSGYPSDPKTRAWLQAVYDETGDFPPFVRRKWETVRRIVAAGRQGRLF